MWSYCLSSLGIHRLLCWSSSNTHFSSKKYMAWGPGITFCSKWNRFISLGFGLSFSCLLRMVELLLVELSGVTITFQVLVVVES